MLAKDIKQRIEELEKELCTLENESSKVETSQNPSKIKDIMKQISDKTIEISILKDLQEIGRRIQDTTKIIKNEKDLDLLTLAKDDLEDLKKQQSDKEQYYRNALSGGTEEDYDTVIIEIRAGTGGEEANLFASELFRMYSKYAESKGCKVQILSKNQSGTGGFKDIVAELKCKGIYKKLHSESGVHRVQRIPVTESSGRIHTSAASVVVYPLKTETEIEIDPNDLKIDSYRSSGPGGQSVNTTDSAIRITHIPTGTIVTCQDEKSQHKNKKKALSILSSKLESLKQEQDQEKLSEVRKDAIKTGDRSAKIRTYNYPQNRITDHRIKKSWHSLKSILDGNLDQVIETLENNI